MNSRLAKASVAGAAALALAVGGSTFAAWSDFGEIAGNDTAAGHLKLDLRGSGVTTSVNEASIAPGERRTIDFFVSSADLDGAPAAQLRLSVLNVLDHENGCGSASSEAAADPSCAGSRPNSGEFSQEAYVRVRHSDPVPADTITFSDDECSTNGASPVGAHNTRYGLGELEAFSPVDLVALEDAEGICVRIDLGLDRDATNAVQSDSSTFDLRFDLEQIL